MAGQMPQSANRLSNRAERGLVAVGTILAVAGDASDHEARIDRMKLIRADPQPLQLARAQVLHQHVGACRQFQEDLAVTFEVELDRQLVAAMNAEPNRIAVHGGTPATERIAARRLHLDHFRAEIGQNAGAEWGRDIVADFEDFQARQRTQGGLDHGGTPGGRETSSTEKKSENPCVLTSC